MGLFDVDCVKAKIVGVRTAEKTTTFADINFGIYSLLVQHKNGTIELIEVEFNKMKKYVPYIEW